MQKPVSNISFSTCKLCELEKGCFTASDFPFFCILPPFFSYRRAKKIQKLQITYPLLIWLFPDTFLFFRKKIPFLLQPLYFIHKNRQRREIVYDQRFLKVKNSLYKLPPLKIDPSSFFLKTKEQQEEESLFFFPQRNFSFYCKGDTSSQLLQTSYKNSLKTRQECCLPRRLSSFYLYLKNKLDQ